MPKCGFFDIENLLSLLRHSKQKKRVFPKKKHSILKKLEILKDYCALILK